MNTINSISTKKNSILTNTGSLSSTSTVTEVVQVPSKENNYTAVVQAEQSTAQGTIKDFGSASSEHSNTEDPKELLELARTEAHQKVSSITTHASSNNTSFEAKTQ